VSVAAVAAVVAVVASAPAPAQASASASAAASASSSASACGSLRALRLPDTIIARAETVVAAGKGHSSYCRVVAGIRPVPGSTIGIEVWMPLAAWNGKFLGLGTGGWGGQIPTADLSRGLARGYAVGASDTGHVDARGGGDFAVGHPEQVIDFGYRATHEMTLAARAVLSAFYGRSAQSNYFDGCSTGGREGLMEAQRYPADYDAILARSPDTSVTHEDAGGL